MLALEGCLSGNVPKGQKPRGGAAGPCGRLARTRPVKVVFGPGTFLNEAVGQIQDQFSAQSAAKAAQAERAAKAARALARSQGRSETEARKLGEQAKQLVFAEFVRNTFQLALKYGITSAPQLNDPSFVSRIVFDPNRAAGDAEGALRLHLPGEGQRADPGPAAPGPDRGASATRRSR